MNIDLNGWPPYFDNQGHLLDEYKLRKTTFFYGLADDIRRDAWPFLLNLWERDSSSLNRHQTKEKLFQEYNTICSGWINAVPELFDPEMKQSIKIIDKDVKRTERKHPFFENDGCEGLRMLRRILITLSVYDSELAYVQGMNEIMAPLLLSLRDEYLTFWCFVKLLPMLRDRLLTLDLSPQLSSTADLVQYFDDQMYQHIEHLTGGHWLFCFRWFLLIFKNEFAMGDILKLWDVVFSQYNTAHFDIFVATAIILMHKEQVLACGTSDQLLYFAQSVTAKLDIEVVINYARDLAGKICRTEGLADNLTALVKQADKVPPPLVGFVRRRQCFTNVYSGRQHMNDDLIKRLLMGNATQTTPMFFNCTESPIPIPTQNYLSGIQGARPLALATEPKLAPPPTQAQNIGISPGRTRLRRPDALYKDSVSANKADQVGQSGNEGSYSHNETHQHLYSGGNYVPDEGTLTQVQGDYYNNQYVDHHEPNYTSYDKQYNLQYQQYNDNSQGQYIDNSQSQYIDNSQSQYIDNSQSQYIDNSQSQYIDNSQSQYIDNSQSQYIDNSQGQYVDNTQGQYVDNTQVTTDNTDMPVEQGGALSAVVDDFWDMRISVHTDDALS